MCLLVTICILLPVLRERGETWQKWTALQGFPQASNSGENAIRPKTPGTTASREPSLLHTAGIDVCNQKLF